MAEAHEAEDRTEAATPRRLEKAREQGEVPLSRELATFAALAGATLGLALATGPALRALGGAMATVLGSLHALDLAAASGPLRELALAALRVLLVIAVPAGLLGAAAVLLQTRFLVHAKALKPTLARISPMSGLRRILGLRNLVEFLKALAKLGLFAAILWRVLKVRFDSVAEAVGWAPAVTLAAAGQYFAQVLLALLGALGGLAIIDLLWQRFQHARKHRMSRQEVREELKDTEGNPVVKGRLRQLRESRARRRMIAAVRTADVVITNPTHYAVALHYDRARQGAPRLVAKGVDAMAARIREAAREAKVPLVANPPLARALHQLPLETEIPPEHYQAVAEIIAYVWRLRGEAMG